MVFYAHARLQIFARSENRAVQAPHVAKQNFLYTALSCYTAHLGAGLRKCQNNLKISRIFWSIGCNRFLNSKTITILFYNLNQRVCTSLALLSENTSCQTTQMPISLFIQFCAAKFSHGTRLQSYWESSHFSSLRFSEASLSIGNERRFSGFSAFEVSVEVFP